MITATIAVTLKNGTRFELTEQEARVLSAELNRLFPPQPSLSNLFPPLKREYDGPGKWELAAAAARMPDNAPQSQNITL